MKAFSHVRTFVVGFLLGGVLMAGVVAILAYDLVLQHGLTVQVETEEIAQLVRQQVEEHARAELPNIIEQLQQTMPERVAGRLSQSLKTATIKLYDTEIFLPDAAVENLNTSLREMVLTEIDSSFKKLDSEQLVAEWGQQAETAVQTLLAEQLDGRTFVVRPYEWLAVPVTVITGR